jgi:septum formation protein
VILSEEKSPFHQKLFLASTSPRRAEILAAARWPFEIVRGSVDETLYPNEDAATYVRRLAEAKATTAARELQNGLVLGADTTVVVDNEIMGQPSDDDDARRMLRLLSGKWHDVLTGVALVQVDQEKQKCVVDHETTRVRFCEMSDAEIEWYVSTGEPKGKAGAYGVQGSAALFIEEIAGDYFNIVGLPLRLVYKLSQKI